MNDLRQFIPRALVFLAVFAVVAPSGESHECHKKKIATPPPWRQKIQCEGSCPGYPNCCISRQKYDDLNAAVEAYLSANPKCKKIGAPEQKPCVTFTSSSRRERFTAVAVCGTWKVVESAGTEVAARRQALRKLHHLMRKSKADVCGTCNCISVSVIANCH